MIAAIAAISKNNIIGKDGKIPWKIKGEQKYFKDLTTGNIVIMGRKSYEEIGHPLPNRIMIIVTSQDRENYNNDGAFTASSVEDALQLALSITKTHNNTLDIYFAGGGQVYTEAIKFCDTLYLTIVDTIVEEDDTCVYFPKIASPDYDIYRNEFCKGEINYTRYRYILKEN